MSLQENNSFLSFHSLMFHSKIHEHPACKMNRDEQGGAGRKSEVLSEHTFEWPQSLFAATKIYFLIFNVTFPYQLNGFIPFSQMENIFPNLLINS